MPSKSNQEELERIFIEEGRLMILSLLNRSSAFTANETVLLKGLELFGFAWTTLALRKELSWLEEQLAIDISNVEGLLVIKLTNRGLEVISGKTEVAGVARALPNSD